MSIATHRFKKFLVITHEASLGGAPILLLRLMRLLREDGYRFNTLVMHDGPLYKEFEKISEVCMVYKKQNKKNISQRIKTKIIGEENELEKLIKDADCIFSNTITNGKILSELKLFTNIQVISYIHELATVTTITTNKETLDYVFSLTNLFLIPCKTVEDFIVQSFAIKESNTGILNYYLPPYNHNDEEVSSSFKLRNGITASFVIGSLGTVEWRKGSDIFLQAVRIFFLEYPKADVQFIWMGNCKEEEKIKFMHDAFKLNIQTKIRLIPATAEVKQFWNSIDVLLLPSREDPYPVVVLEAALHKIPAICFKGSGGAPEFIESDAGATVDYLDIHGIKNALCNYYNNRLSLENHGINAFEKVKKKHCDEALIKQQFKAALAKVEV